jgi:hypothetical protein
VRNSSRSGRSTNRYPAMLTIESLMAWVKGGGFHWFGG